MIIGFIGTHRAITDSQKERLCRILGAYRPFVFHSGGCISADEFVYLTVRGFSDCKTVVHPPTNAKAVFDYSDADVILPAKDYLSRNHDIVDCCDVLITMPCEQKEVLRSGVWAAIRYAKKVGKSVFIIYPDNFVEAK